jgi:predicted HicB family RNase H-like nuclease
MNARNQLEHQKTLLIIDSESRSERLNLRLEPTLLQGLKTLALNSQTSINSIIRNAVLQLYTESADQTLPGTVPGTVSLPTTAPTKRNAI